jgi:hypothetical protein
MADLTQLEARMKALDQQISPIANQTVDIAALMRRANVVAAAPQKGAAPVKPQVESPLDQANVTPEAQALVEELIEAYPSSDESGRAQIRAMLAAHESFDWATGLPPAVPDATKNFRRQLLRLSMSDQGRDARDLLTALESRHREAQVAGIDLAPIALEIAAMSSDEDRYGMGSTRRILIQAALRWEKQP